MKYVPDVVQVVRCEDCEEERYDYCPNCCARMDEREET